jgi:formamidopyrimidine-DNA glycosylase
LIAGHDERLRSNRAAYNPAMPEGHTIHRTAKLHTRILVGRKLRISSPQGRFADGARRVTGHTLDHIQPHGKHLFYRFDNGLSIHIHVRCVRRWSRTSWRSA